MLICIASFLLERRGGGFRLQLCLTDAAATRGNSHVNGRYSHQTWSRSASSGPVLVEQRVERTHQAADSARRSWKPPRRGEDDPVVAAPTDDGGAVQLDEICHVLCHQCPALGSGMREEGSIGQAMEVRVCTSGDDVVKPAAQLGRDPGREVLVE